MRLFIRVADTGNFSKAARAAGISQPTASKTIAGLEARLGAQLLRRSSRGLSLTDAGQSFYEGAVEIVENVDEVESRVGNGEASPSGVVRVALSPAFGRMRILPHMAQFSARYPDVCIEFTVAQRYINLIEEGIDVAIRIGPLNDSTQIARRIGSTEYLTVTSPAYADRAGIPQTVDDLADHDCIALMSRDVPRAWPFLGPAGPIEHIPQGPVRSNDAEYVRAAVIAGLGIGHNASWLYARDVDEGRLVALLEPYRPAAFPIHAVWPGSRRLPGRTRVFIEFLAELFAADPLLMIR
ncbi:transcriptional regulator LysR family [Caballeronia insecticola]|uniref:Transcriptional regulator LysR family n=2 Tax=Caballeronia insecticola TaxID=758793 RepID=R4X3G7_9BURK|nr:transcriptional regulator LysR family [Caballeronia insecticola]